MSEVEENQMSNTRNNINKGSENSDEQIQRERY